MPTSQVLVVDDDRQEREVLAEILTKEGVEVSEAGDGAKGLAMLEAKPYQVLFTNFQTPGMSGLTLVRRAMQLRPDLAAILMSSHGKIDSCIEAMRMGVRDFVTTPFTMETVRQALARALDSRSEKCAVRANQAAAAAASPPGQRSSAPIRVCWVKARRCARSGSSPRRSPPRKPRF